MMGDGFDRDRLRDSKTQVQPSGFLQFPLREVDAGGDLRRSTPPLVRCAPAGHVNLPVLPLQVTGRVAGIPIVAVGRKAAQNTQLPS